MIEDKKIGLKVATKEEAQWIDTKDFIEERVLKSKVSVELDEVMLEYIKTKLESFPKK